MSLTVAWTSTVYYLMFYNPLENVQLNYILYKYTDSYLFRFQTYHYALEFFLTDNFFNNLILVGNYCYFLFLDFSHDHEDCPRPLPLQLFSLLEPMKRIYSPDCFCFENDLLCWVNNSLNESKVAVESLLVICNVSIKFL